MKLRVLLPGGRTYTYEGKWEKEGSPIGWRVLVPTKKGGTTGIVTGISDDESVGKIISFPDDSFLVDQLRLSLIDELSLDYLLPKGVLLFNLLPASFLWREKEFIVLTRKNMLALDRKSTALVEYLKRRRKVSPETLKKRFGAELVSLLLSKGIIARKKEWDIPDVKERFFRLAKPFGEALKEVRSSEGKRLVTFLSGRECISEEELNLWGFSRKTLRKLVQRGIVKQVDECARQTHTSSEISFLKETGWDRKVLWCDFKRALNFTLSECSYNLSARKSTLVLFPEREHLREVLPLLKGTFGDRVYEVHSGVPTKKLIKSWFRIQKEPCVVVGTYIACLCPAYNMGSVILFDESSPGNRLIKPPVDLRKVAYILSRKVSARLILLSPAPSLSAYYLCISRKAILEKELGNVRIEVLRREATQILTEDLVDILKREEDSILFLVPKQGYSYAYCPRCDILLECPKCETFLTYSREKRKLYCTRCKFEEERLECFHCGGHLRESGFGLEKVIELVEESIGIKESFRFATHPVWSEEHDTVIILSADNLLSVPSYRAKEEALIYVLRALTSSRERLIIQTVIPEEFKLLREKRFGELYMKELEERKRALLPPFYRLLLIRVRKKELAGYVYRFLSPHIRVSPNPKKGSYDILVRFKGKDTLWKVKQLREKFGKDIIEIKLDPF